MKKVKVGKCYCCSLNRIGCGRVPPGIDKECKYWKLSACYTCKYAEETDEEKWISRGCNEHAYSGCKNLKRSWKKMFKVLKDIYF